MFTDSRTILFMIKSLLVYWQIKKAKYYKLSIEAGWVFIGQFLSLIGALVLVRVLTGYLDPEQYGQLALGLTVAGFVNQVIMGGVVNGISRFYSVASEERDLNGYIKATWLLLAIATSLVTAVGIMLLVILYFSGYSYWAGLTFVTLIFAVLSGYNSALNGIQNAARQRKIVAFHGGMDALLKILLSVIAMQLFEVESTFVVIGYASSAFIIMLSQLVIVRRTILSASLPRETSKNWVSPIRNYSLPFMTWGVFTWLQQISDRWALEKYGSSTDVGEYAVLFQIGFAPLAVLTGMVSSFLLPILFQKAGDGTEIKRNANVHYLSWKATHISLIITFIAVVLSINIHEVIFRYVVASEYWKISPYFPWMVLAGGLFSTGQILASKLISKNTVNKLKKVKIISSIIGVLLNVICAKYWGLAGVVVSINIFSIVHLLWIALLCKNEAKGKVIE